MTTRPTQQQHGHPAADIIMKISGRMGPDQVTTRTAGNIIETGTTSSRLAHLRNQKEMGR